MRVGVPTEIKDNEFRVAITPAGAHDLVGAGHDVVIQSGAGRGSNIADDDYVRAGASVVPSAEEVWQRADLLLKVKEPLASEYQFFRPDLVIFTFLHLAAQPELTGALIDSGVTAVAYETVQLANRSLPLLAPMSEVAGRLSVLVGTNVLTKPGGGMGLLASGVPGTTPANVVILGGGVAGTNAAQMAVGIGAHVTVLDTNLARLRDLDALYQGRLRTAASTPLAIDEFCRAADLVIGSVLIPGARAPKLVSNELVAQMKPGSVLVDIAVDQGGCFADTHPTTHADPTYEVHGSVFYSVANMPGAVPQTSTHALTNATLPYVRSIANLGWRDALLADPALGLGLNVGAGKLTNEAVARAVGVEFSSVDSVVAGG